MRDGERFIFWRVESPKESKSIYLYTLIWALHIRERKKKNFYIYMSMGNPSRGFTNGKLSPCHAHDRAYCYKRFDT